MKTYLPIIAFLFLFSSCGEPKKMGPNQVDHLMDRLGLRIDMAKHSYENYLTIIDLMGGGSMHKLMMDGLNEQRELIDKVVIYEEDEYLPNDSPKLKKLAIDIIEAYISVAENELMELDEKRLKSTSKSGQKLMDSAAKKISDAYEAYGALQQKMADEYGITLY